MTSPMKLAALALAAAAGLGASAAGAATMTEAQARAIVTPLYEALNEPAKKDVPALLAKAANPDYKSCSTLTDCVTRDQLAGIFASMGKAIPDLHWAIKYVWVSGDRIVVLGEASGTPKEAFFGIQPTGKGFKTISIDSFLVKNGKLSQAYHVENWAGAIQQMNAK